MMATFTYGQVEAALASMHNVNEKSAGAFHARINRFQKLGIVPVSPGKGQKIAYDARLIIIWAFALELSQFRITPEFIKRIVSISGQDIIDSLYNTTVHGDQIYYIDTSILSEHLNNAVDKYKSFGIVSADEMAGRVSGDGAFTRLLLVNLSVMRRQLVAAFGSRFLPKQTIDRPVRNTLALLPIDVDFR